MKINNHKEEIMEAVVVVTLSVDLVTGIVQIVGT
jgi:hypothetical protein